MRRRTLLRGASAPVLPALLAACAGDAGGPRATPGEPVTLRHVPWPGIPASRAAQTAVVEDWNRRHPAVQVREEELAGEGNHYQKLIVQVAGGSAPDLTFMQGSHDYVAFAARGQLLPIEGFIGKDRAFDRQASGSIPARGTSWSCWGTPGACRSRRRRTSCTTTGPCSTRRG